MSDQRSSVAAGRQHLLRSKTGDGHARVTFVELFFDLVFVFAVTQLSHLLLHHLTLVGALQTSLLLVAVWWVWIYTSWMTNWLDPEATSVRLMLFAMMLAGLIMATSIPQAFEARALWFALAYVAMQVGRSLYTLWALHGQSPVNYRNFQRITVWFLISGVLWIAGGLAEGQPRFALWAGAILLEVMAPSLGFWTPGLGRSTAGDWDIAGGHLAERCGLFVIIALGESILLTGATFTTLTWNATSIAAFCICVVGSIAMWWIYFNIGAARASRLIAASPRPGVLGRLAYTYLHIVIVAGIIVCAASDEIVLKHPHGHHELTGSLILTGGPALFLLGCLLFKWVTAGWPPLSHMVGIGLLAVLLAASGGLSPLLLGMASTLVLVVVAFWETASLKDEAASLRERDHAQTYHTASQGKDG
jgi:low temperature requirement protein LtrA